MNLGRQDFDYYKKRGFYHMDPDDFYQLMAELFESNGYRIVKAVKRESSNPDMVIEKEGVSTRVHIFRYPPEQKADVLEVQEVLSTAAQHHTEQSMMVTTSSFTGPAQALNAQSGIFMWDGAVLAEAVEKSYPDPSFPMFDPPSEMEIESDGLFSLRVSEVSPDQYLPEGQDPVTKVVLELSNDSGRNLRLFLNLPVLIRHDQKQYTARDWMKDSFTSGMIFKDAKVDLIFYFPESQLKELHQDDRILLAVSVPALSHQKTYSTTLMPEDNRCFVVTFAFSRNSPSYREAILFRDEVLMRTEKGKKIVEWYYRHSPGWVRILEDKRWLTPLIRRILRMILKVISGLRKIFG